MTEPVAITNNREMLRSSLEQQIRETRPLRAVNYTDNWMDIIGFFSEIGKRLDTFETIFSIQLTNDESLSAIVQVESLFRANPRDWLPGVLLGYYYFAVLQDTERCSAVMSDIANLIGTPTVCQAINDRLQLLNQGITDQPRALYQRQEAMLNQRLTTFTNKHGQRPCALMELAQTQEEQPLFEELSQFWAIDPESGQIILKEYLVRHRKASDRHQRMSRVVRHQPTTFEQPDNQ